MTTTWLHDVDSLRAFADEPGPVGSWARLQLLGRGQDAGLPRDWMGLGPALALGTSGVDDWIDDVDASTVEPLCKAVLHVGAGPDADESRWERALAGLLDGPGAADAATTLMLLGCLRKEHLVRALAAAPSHPATFAWVLGSVAASERARTASQIAEALRADLGAGAEVTLTTLMLLNGGLVGRSPNDPFEAARRGATVAGGDLPPPPSAQGSVRARVGALVEALAGDQDTPAAHLVRAIGRLRKGPAVPAYAVLQLAWGACFTPGPSPADDVARGLRGWRAVGAARARVLAGADRPSSADTPTHAALIAAALHRDPSGAKALRDADPFEEGTDLCRFAAACVDPSIVVDLLDDPARRDEGLALSPLAPTEEVLERLVVSPVPAHPGDRRSLAWGLARSGSPAAIPVLQALCGHLEPSVVSEVRAQVASILGREL